MSDPADAWRQYQLKAGEAALELLAAGEKWPAIADRLHIGDIDTVRRCAALALSADLAQRREARA